MSKKANFIVLAAISIAAMVMVGCSSEDENIVTLSGNENVPVLRSAAKSCTATIDFESVPADVMASDKYGNNLYSATAPAGKQVTKGYFYNIKGSETYVQFPINYLEQEWEAGKPWRYEYWNGGCAMSKFNDMSQGDFHNQLSVYYDWTDSQIHKFAVAFGYSDSYNDPGRTFDKCSKIYFTDATGYEVKTEKQPVSGNAKTGIFNSVNVCNTTYAYLVMKNGNEFTQGSLESKGGWFKVVFIGLDQNGHPKGNTVEYYLADFAGKTTDLNGIRENWNRVDLSSIGECSTLVINFEGSDSGDYGLNTPAYVALDDLSVTVACN